jgi:spore photoproduct lyase
MFPVIYIEEQIKDHPRVLTLCERFTSAPKVFCKHYGEIFNKKAQNFRLQKKKPSLILARKHQNHLLPIPKGYGIGGQHNFYFSHMLNCLYDCRYCFLQGMYASAHYVVFVNYEDFQKAILEKLESLPGEEVYFFSGYDCDSLAMEPVTRFFDAFYPLFMNHPKAYLELRTKSFGIQPLLQKKPIPNCIIAFSLTPEPISKELEHKTPSIGKRLEAMQKLQKEGWQIGIRLDPLIYCKDYQKYYRDFFDLLFTTIDPKKIHSITLGAFRLPKPVFKNMLRLYPEEKLFGCHLQEDKMQVSYSLEQEKELFDFCLSELTNYVPSSLLFFME